MVAKHPPLTSIYEPDDLEKKENEFYKQIQEELDSLVFDPNNVFDPETEVFTEEFRKEHFSRPEYKEVYDEEKNAREAKKLGISFKEYEEIKYGKKNLYDKYSEQTRFCKQFYKCLCYHKNRVFVIFQPALRFFLPAKHAKDTKFFDTVRH